MSARPAISATDAIAAIDQVCSRIENSFARVGDQLGRGHAIFKELNGDLGTLAGELCGTSIEDATAAVQEIARRLDALAEGLPAESALLGSIGAGAAEAASLLQPLFKHIQMITIIARSARIEAASLEKDRESFVDFTREALELGESVKHSIEASARDQAQLSEAVAAALSELAGFEKAYGAQLVSVAAELTSAHAGMSAQRGNSVTLAERAGASTKQIAEAVVRAIVSLQSGDSTRQRLEHICHALGIAANDSPSIVPAPADVVALGSNGVAGAHPSHRQRSDRASDPGEGLRSLDQHDTTTAALICRLQSMQLKDAHDEFGRDIGQIVRSLDAIVADATGVVALGRSLSGGDDDTSFLAAIRQALAQASRLIATCERAGQSVDGALAVVSETLLRFREAIGALSEVVVDIILIGMNASLKAAHLGAKGNAFVVIANELKATADQVSATSSRLKPVLDRIERAAGELKERRDRSDPAKLAELEPSVLRAMGEVEAGSRRLGGLMARLSDGRSECERLIGAGRETMTALLEACRTLPSIASRLEQQSAPARAAPLAPGAAAAFDDLFARYTMEREREVHAAFLAPLGLKVPVAAPVAAGAEEDDGVLLF